MIEREEEGLKWLEFEQLAEIKGLMHRVFTRHGGVSKEPFKGLNFSVTVGDCKKAVEINRKRIKMTLPGVKKVLLPHLCHSKKVMAVCQESKLKEPCDGLATKESGLGLMVTHADCQAALFFDPIERAISAVHCGWKGNVLNIYKNTVELMKKKFGSKASNLLVCISPSLGPESAEFKNYREELPESFWGFQKKPYYFDLWEISKKQLLAEGVLENHIEIAGIDTFVSKKDFFSHRRERPGGRNATVIALSPCIKLPL